MQIICTGTAKIAHKDTGQVYEIAPAELDWETIDSNERQMGHENHYKADIEHEVLGPISWSLWEYPVGVQNHRETDANGHRVVSDFDYGLSHTPERDGE